MDNSIAVGAVVGLIIASSLYIWNSDEFTKEQKTFLLIAVVFAPVQWIGILVIKYYNNRKFESTPVRKTSKNLDSTISDLTELKNKGIITEKEYRTKVEKIHTAKTEQNLKNSLEYRQLKSLLDGGILTKDEFENKIKLLQSVSEHTNEVKNEQFNIRKVENLATFKDGSMVSYNLYYRGDKFYFYEIEKTKKVFISINKKRIYFDNRGKFIEYVKQKY